MMRTGRAWALACLLFVPLQLGGLARPQGLAKQEQKSIVLAFAPRPQQALSYSFLSRMNTEGQGFLGKSLTLSAVAEGGIDFLIRQASSDAVFADLSTLGLRVFLQAPGSQNEYILSAPPDNPVRVVFDRAGRIRDVQNAESLEEQNVLNFSVVEVLRNSLPSLPDKPIALGDSWPDHKRLVLPFQGMRVVAEVEVAFRLDDVSPAQEGRLALVSAVYTVTLSGLRELEGAAGAFEGKGTGTGSLVFLIDEGYFTHYRLDYAIDGALVLKKEGATLVEWPFRLLVGAELLLLEKRLIY